ncbi:MAG TPA: hypothetical protein DIT13_14160 [Verrucomicrobiales bacterium]|nr:hypothetical protein [Verrucomicrobiales bacterium]HRJ09628.1 alpha/beta hydrolase-fold protein [Prosthecobacter sp.]HRK15995.1 alpha/beta hydrolase-fold protein [Prosthecobacter sp.]
MNRQDELFAAYLDGTITAAEERELAAWMAGSAEHARAFVEACLREQQLTAAVRASARRRSVEIVHQRAAEPPPSSRPSKAFRRLLPLAAAAAVVAGWMGWQVWDPSPVAAYLSGRLGGVTVERAGEKLSANEHQPLSEGDLIQTRTGGAIVSFAGEDTRFDLGADARVRVRSLRGRKEFQLLSGTVSAEVAPQRRGAMLWLTDDARAEIVGTKFTLAAAGWFTRLDVTEGAVRFSRHGDSEPTLVKAEQFAAADVQGTTGACSIDEFETAPWSVPGRRTPGFEHVTFRSNRLDREIGVNVMLPPGYDRDRRGGYPVLYLLHAMNGDEHSEAARLGTALRSAMEDRRLPPCLVVAPNSGPAFPREPMFANVMVARELTRFVDSRYPTRAQRGMRVLCGLGYGAQQAVILSLFHTDVFALGCAVDDTLRGGSPGFRRLGIHHRPRPRIQPQLLLLHTDDHGDDARALADFLNETGVETDVTALAARHLDDEALPTVFVEALATRLQLLWNRPNAR